MIPNVQGLRRNVKNVVRNYSDAQVKVREATSNDPWGPSGTLMSEIADLTYNVVAFSEIMQVIWKRLNDHGKNWKHVYKALVLLEYLIKTGSEKVTQQCKENIFAIQTLKDFQYFEEGAKDQGVNVREKAKQLVALLKDDERLKNERVRALKARERFVRSSAGIRQEQPLQRQYGSNEFSPGSLDDKLSDLPISDLEHARPQTVGEEELQLQLALAMSREEQDAAERLKRNDQLRLQMALSESKEEFKKVKEGDEKDTASASSAVDDLLGLSLNNSNGIQSGSNDPWGLPVQSPQNSNDLNSWYPLNIFPEENENMIRSDPWSPINDNSSDIYASPNASNEPFDVSAMRKSLSADVCQPDGIKSLDALLSPESSLIKFDATARPRHSNSNPFQTMKPTPMSINEMRAQRGHQASQLPSSTSMPLYTGSPQFSSQNNPFI